MHHDHHLAQDGLQTHHDNIMVMEHKHLMVKAELPTLNRNLNLLNPCHSESLPVAFHPGFRTFRLDLDLRLRMLLLARLSQTDMREVGMDQMKEEEKEKECSSLSSILLDCL